MYNAKRSFFSIPLSTAREIAGRVVLTVMMAYPDTVNFGGDTTAQRALCVALQAEFPRKASRELTYFVADSIGTAHSLATSQWRKQKNHQRGESPNVDAAWLRAGLIIHLNGTPDGLPARLDAEMWARHRAVNKHFQTKTREELLEGMRELADLHTARMEAVTEYWQSLSDTRTD